MDDAQTHAVLPVPIEGDYRQISVQVTKTFKNTDLVINAKDVLLGSTENIVEQMRFYSQIRKLDRLDQRGMNF